MLSGETTAVTGRIRASYREVELPFESTPTLEELRKEASSNTRPGMARRARFLLDRVSRGDPISATYPYPVQVWALGSETLFVTLGGEAVADYALGIKREFGPGRTWVASYANDVMAYIPSQRVLREGGYEGRTSMLVYGLQSAWGPQIEPLIRHSVRQQIDALGSRMPRGTTRLDFEDSFGTLGEDWYVSGGMNATRLRTGPRGRGGTWALTTAGDSNYPTTTPNVAASAIDRDTSIAWGPVFTVADKLPDGARISFRIAGGSKPWTDSATDGPTGLALWDLAAATFARDESSRVVYAACETNGFDFEPASLSLAGLAGKTLALVLVDRAMQSWAWTGVDDIAFTRGCVSFSKHTHHAVTVIGDFDRAESLAGWTGDKKSFGLASETALFVNQDMRGGRHAFPIGVGYLSSAASGDAATGVLLSPELTLDGDIVEFYLAGGGQTRIELVSDGGKVLARATPASPVFVYAFWPVKTAWRGSKARIRIVDDAKTARIEVDAIRLVKFDVAAKGRRK